MTVSPAPTRRLQFPSTCRFLSSTLPNGRPQPSSTEGSDRCRSDQKPGPFRCAGDDRDIGDGRQVHQQLDEDVLHDGILVGGLLDTAATSAQQARVALVGSTIYPSPTEPPIPDSVVVIENGRISAVGQRDTMRVPDGIATLECSGSTITAGFWNSHVHFFEDQWTDAANIPAPRLADQLRAMLLRYGFTSVFDLSSPWENTQRIRARIESGEVAGPRIRSTGAAIVGDGWMPPDDALVALGLMLFPAPVVGGAAGARAAARALLEAGADGIKVFPVQPFAPFATLTDDTIRAAVDEAHRHGKPAFAHPTHAEGLLAAVRAGVDVVPHTTRQFGSWGAAVLAAIEGADVTLIPTLKVWQHHLRDEPAAVRAHLASTSTDQLRAWRGAGGTVVFGTDAGGINDYDPSDEYALMAEAGMTFGEILATLTTTPAAIFGRAATTGRIAPGQPADLVVLDGDPSQNVRVLADVRYTLRDGSVVYP